MQGGAQDDTLQFMRLGLFHGILSLFESSVLQEPKQTFLFRVNLAGLHPSMQRLARRKIARASRPDIPASACLGATWACQPCPSLASPLVQEHKVHDHLLRATKTVPQTRALATTRGEVHARGPIVAAASSQGLAQHAAGQQWKESLKMMPCSLRPRLTVTGAPKIVPCS